MKTKIKKIVVVTMLVIMLLPMQLIQVFATDIGDSPYLQRGKLGDYIVQYYNGSYWTYISYNIVTYDDGTGNRKVAYCVTPNTPGIEWTSESTDGYNVNITELLSDPVLWRVLRHGYPYATPEQLGVEGEEDAYLATKIAVQCILLNRSTDSIKTYYRGGRDAVAGLKLADITRRGDKVVNAIYNLVNNARNSNETPANNTIVNATKVGDLKAEGNYYSQEYSVSSSTQMSYYTINKIVGFPSGSFASDLNGNAKTQFNNGENFKIMIPKSSAGGNISGEITVDAHCETYSIFYGESTRTGYQNYALYTDPYRDLRKTILTNVDLPMGQIKVIKVDKDNQEVKLEGVIFEVLDSKGNVVQEITTDKNGEAITNKLPTNEEYRVKEKITKQEYVLSDKVEKVTLKQDQITTLTFTNEKKKGQVKVIKVDADHNEIKLKDVEFKIYNESGEEVDSLKTDANGEATSKKLAIDQTYTVKETKTQSSYILNETPETVVLKENQITNITFTNKKKEGSLKLFKVDKDNNKIGLGNVEFNLLSKEFNKVVGTYKTDANGEIEVKNLRIGNYTWIEKVTNKFYNLAKDTQVKVEWKNTTETTVENELKKGQVKVIKVDKDNNEYKIENVKFNVLDANGNILETIKTDKNGEALTSKYAIRDFETLTLQEVETKENYVLNDEKVTVTLKENQITTIKFENEKIKGKIRVVKTSEDENKINGLPAGTPLENVKFKVYDSNKKLVDTITTDEKGIAVTKKLNKGKYTIKEVETAEWYLLNTKEFDAEIKENNEIVDINVTNKSERPEVDIEKTGVNKVMANEEIRYDFKIKNTGNVPVDNFTWTDYLPSDYVRITKLATGTYNQELKYAVYYKTNKNDYKLLKDDLNTKENNYIDFTELELDEDEYVTEFKAEFGTVDVGLESVENPYIFTTVNSTVKDGDIFINKTKIKADNKGVIVWDEDEHTTVVYEKKEETKKLPRTGF